MIGFQLKVEKPWGYELIFTDKDSPTVCKILHINAGFKISLQYHEVKDETLVLFNGEVKMVFGESKENLSTIDMEKLKGYFIPRKLIHRIVAITDCDIFESSTKEEGVTVRIEDDFNRGDETEEERTKNRS